MQKDEVAALSEGPNEERSASQAELVRRAIGEDIMMGRLRPGEFLSEVRIGERFNVSRTPVREAIRSLAGDGLVTLRPRQRAVVKGQTAAEILDQFEAMAELEAICAKLAARRRSEQDLEKMEAAHAECRAYAEESNLDAYYSANVRLHEAIYAASGNAYIEERTLRLRDRLRFLRITQGRLPGRLKASSSEHDAVVDAIRRRDETGAADAMRAHVTILAEALRRMLRHTDETGIVHLADMPGMAIPFEENERAKR